MKKKKPPKKLVSSTKLTRTTLKEDIGKLMLDVGKLVFAGIVITMALYRQLNVALLLREGDAFLGDFVGIFIDNLDEGIRLKFPQFVF